MQKGREILSSIEYRPKHVSLTHFLRRNWYRSPNGLQAILSKCTIAPYVGALPPQLRARVTKDELSDVTHEFRMRLEDFLIDKFDSIMGASDTLHYDMARIGDLFRTQCHLNFGDGTYLGLRQWAGFSAVVAKMSFPELNAEYALKVFYDTPYMYASSHGFTFEVPTAFAAVHAEPRDNSRVYMASLIYHPYILSMWEGDNADGRIRKNENQIFETSVRESADRNYRGGRRIDYGETYRTLYGAASYNVRKMYRKIKNAIGRDDVVGLVQMARDASVAAPAAYQDFEKAVELVSVMMCKDIYEIIRGSKNY